MKTALPWLVLLGTRGVMALRAASRGLRRSTVVRASAEGCSAFGQGLRATYGGHARREAEVEVAAAVVARQALEALKPALAQSWDSDAPLFLPAAAEGAFGGWFGLETLRETCDLGEVSEAGRGVLGVGGAWQMRRVGLRGRAVTWAEVSQCLEEASTVVLNSADAHSSRLAGLSLAALDAFGLPVCVNAYATGAGAVVSAPPHTDKQRVLVLHTAGAKRWRVFSPPPPARSACDPLARGKGEDSLVMRELSELPLLDVVLRAGDALYVPAGFPHVTDTVDSTEASLHLTLGVDTHIWGLDALQARAGAVRRAGLADALTRPEQQLDSADYWRLRGTLPALGWRASGDHAADLEQLARALADAAVLAEPARFADAADARATLLVDPLAARLVEHARALAAAQRELYADVLFHLRPAPSTAARAAPHYGALEATMEHHVRWFGPAVDANFAHGWSCGDELQATMQGTTVYFDATVHAVTEDALDLVFFDGDFERGVSLNRVRPKKKTKATTKTKGGSSNGGFGAAKGPAKPKKKR